jgi:antitoxin CcdA
MAATAPKAEGPALPQKLLDEAVRLKVDLTGRSEDEVRRAVREAWIDENREAIESSNAWVEKHGLPLAKYRQF